MKKLLSIALTLIMLAAAIALPACRKPEPAVNDSLASTEAPEDARTKTTAPEDKPTEMPTEAPTAEPTVEPTKTPITLPEPTEYASAETHALAEAMITRMREEHSGFAPGTALYEQSFEAMPYYVPELAELEAADDCVLALIELHEELIVKLSTFDLVGQYTNLKIMNTTGDRSYAETELYAEGMALYTDNVNIEGLLAMPAFFDRLTDGQRERFYYDINVLWSMRNDANNIANDNLGAEHSQLNSCFDNAKREQDVTWEKVFVAPSGNNHTD